MAAILALYLPKAATFDRLLQPALSCIILLVSLIVAVNDSAYSAWPFWSALALFVISGVWLVTQGEIRSGIASVARREQRIKEFTTSSQESLASSVTLGDESPTPTSNPDGVEMFDPRIIELVEKQKKRRQCSGSIGEHDLIAGDIHHRPVIVLTFVIGLLADGTLTWMSCALRE